MSASCLSPRSNFIGAHAWSPYFARNWSAQSLRNCVMVDGDSLYSPIGMTLACAVEAQTNVHTAAATTARTFIRRNPSGRAPPQAPLRLSVPGAWGDNTLLRQDRHRRRVWEQLAVGRRADQRRPRAGQVADARLERAVHVDVGVDAQRLALVADGVAGEDVRARARVARRDRAEEHEAIAEVRDRRARARRAAGTDAGAVAVVQDLLDGRRVRVGRDLALGQVAADELADVGVQPDRAAPEGHRRRDE